jgi:integrase
VPSKLAPGIRERRPGYFEVRVYGGLDPDTGKARQVCRSVRGTVKDANELRASLLLEIARTGASSQHTLAELFDAVIEHLSALGREPTTLHGYEGIARRVPDRLRNKTLRKLKASDLDGFYARMLRAGTSPARVRRYHAFIHRCLAQAVKWDWVGDNVSDRAEPPAEPHRQVELQDTAAIGRLIEAAEQSTLPEMAIAFRLLAATGGRRGEAAGLQWHDIDFDTGLCRIERAVKQISGQPLIVGDAKNHQKRIVQLDPTTIGVLVDHHQRMVERAEFCRVTMAAEAFVLSDSPDGAEPWKPSRITQALNRLRPKAGYTGRLHDLRHWHASLLLGAGEPPVVVAGRLGHRDPSTTNKWYAHVMPRADARAAALVDDALARRPSS